MDELDDFFLNCLGQGEARELAKVDCETADQPEDFLDIVCKQPDRPDLGTQALRRDAVLMAFPDATVEVVEELVLKAVEEVVSFMVAPDRTPRERATFEVYLQQGYVTKQDCYDRGFDPVVTRDLTKHGIIFSSSQGRIYLDLEASNAAHGGPAIITSRQRDRLIEEAGHRCQLCGGQFMKKRLVIDHCVPHRVVGNALADAEGDEAFQVLCYVCNNRKQQACRACPNQTKDKDPDCCRACFWASPNQYEHVATRQERRLTLIARTPRHVAILDKLEQQLPKYGIDTRR